MIVQFGTGRVLCSWGLTADERQDRALLLELVDEPHEVGTVTGDATGEKVEDSDRVVMMNFPSIESARVLQDVLGEMIGKWSRELSPVAKDEQEEA